MVENAEDHTCFIPVANFVSVLCGRKKAGGFTTAFNYRVICDLVICDLVICDLVICDLELLIWI